jgi:outer membrane protein TolC
VEEEFVVRQACAIAAWMLPGWLLAASPLGAQQSPTSPSGLAAVAEHPAPPVDTLVALALARAPEIAAQRERAAAASERVGGAGAFEDPMLDLAYRNAGFPEYTVGEAEMSMIEIGIEQPLPFPGKRGARRRAASAMAAVGAADLHTVERRVATEVRVLYAQLYAVDRTRARLLSARVLLRLLETTAAGRYASGTSEMEPQVRAQLAVSRLEERLEDLNAERRALLAEINRYLDRPADTVLGVVDTLPGMPSPPSDWQERAVAHAPEVLAARAAVAAAERGLAVEESERRPDLVVGAGYGYRGALDPVVTLRVGTELPLWRSGRQEPRIRAAAQEAAMARSEQRNAEARARSTAESQVAAWERSDAQVRRYREAILPQSWTALDAARAAYEAGKGDFSTVIEDFDLWLEAQEQLAVREAERFVARARLDALVAAPPGAAGGSEEGKP